MSVKRIRIRTSDHQTNPSSSSDEVSSIRFIRPGNIAERATSCSVRRFFRIVASGSSEETGDLPGSLPADVPPVDTFEVETTPCALNTVMSVDIVEVPPSPVEDVNSSEVVILSPSTVPNPLPSQAMSLSDDESQTLSSSSSSVEEPVAERVLFLAFNEHAGRCKCFTCHQRITREQTRLDYKPRAQTLRHCHLDCLPNTKALPSGLSNRIGFPSTVSDEEKSEITAVIRSRCTPQGIEIDPVVPLTAAERHALGERNARDRRIQREQAAAQRMGRHRYFAARTNPYMFGQDAPFSGVDALLGYAPVQSVFEPIFYGNRTTGLSEEILASLPRFTCCDEAEETACVVCLDNMGIGDEIIVLPCFHRFHAGCIESWLKNSKLCPIDKVNVEQSAGRVDIHYN